MIYLDNNSEIQRVYIPRETLNIETVVPIPDDQLSDYYTKSEVDDIVDNIETTDLTDYYTKTEVDDIVDNIDLTGYATKDYVANTCYTKSEIDTMVGDINTLLASI